MALKHVFLFALCILITLASVRARGEDVPPARGESSLPSRFVSATKLLFDDGMSDPRGGEYRAITIRSRSAWPPGGVITTRGWVLPAPEGSNEKRAVAWNGLTYSVVTDVGAANLSDDIAVLLKARSVKPEPEVEPSQLRRIFAPEKDFVDDWRPLELTAAGILVRLGKADLAKQCCSAAALEADENSDAKTRSRSDPFLEIADNWISSIYDRAVSEHVRGDDRLSADDSEMILRVSRRIENQAASRGSKLTWGSEQTQHAPAYFDFLTYAADILADSKRRLATPRPDVSIARLLSSHGEPNDLISLLISHLDDIRSGQQMIPGSVRFDSDPVVEALVREGDGAVDPLLAAMEHDNRLTRFQIRERHRDRSDPVPVRYGAFFCLTRILRTSDFGGTGNATVADIRAYWNANRRLSLPDRWFHALNDDSATPDRWLAAAKNIVAPVGFIEDSMVGGESRRSYGSGRAPMQGESLRTRMSPSVSSLLAHRVAQLARARRHVKASTDDDDIRFYNSVTIALDLAQWDLKASLPTLKMAATRILVRTRSAGSTDGLPSNMAQITVARIHAGDTSAAADYVSYIRQIKSADLAMAETDVFAPIYEYPENPLFLMEADALFDGAISNLNPISQPAGPSAGDKAVGSRLLCVPAFRRQVLRELDDHRPAGKGRMEENSQVSWNRGGGNGIYTPNPPPDPQKFQVGATFTFRLCDLYAWEVSSFCVGLRPTSRAQAAPKFELYWPAQQRDSAVAQMKDFLMHEGPRLRPADFQ